MGATIAVTLPIFGFIATGLLASRLKLLGANATDVLNRFVAFLALPALLFDAMSRLRWQDVAYPGVVVAVGGGMAVTFIVAVWLGRREGRPLADRGIQGLAASFSNAGFMGVPLCKLALGEDSLIPAVIATVLTASVLFGCAITVIEGDLQTEPSVWRTLLKVARTLARNPLLVAPVTGALVAGSGLPVPAAAGTFLKLLAGAATPCALIALGFFLAERSVRFEPRLIGRLVLLKLVLQPVLTGILVFQFVDLPPLWAKTALLMSALPTGTGPFILSKHYEREGASTAGAVLVSTVLSFATVSGLLAWFATAPR